MKTTQYTEVVFQWHIRNNSDGSITFGQKILIYESSFKLLRHLRKIKAEHPLKPSILIYTKKGESIKI